MSKDVVLSEDVATAILDYSERTRADLIALATSRNSGMSRFVFGTVADEVTRKSLTSLFVFHPKRSSAIANAGERSSAETLAGV